MWAGGEANGGREHESQEDAGTQLHGRLLSVIPLSTNPALLIFTAYWRPPIPSAAAR
jgi:hypothetical protein